MNGRGVAVGEVEEAGIVMYFVVSTVLVSIRGEVVVVSELPSTATTEYETFLGSRDASFCWFATGTAATSVEIAKRTVAVLKYMIDLVVRVRSQEMKLCSVPKIMNKKKINKFSTLKTNAPTSLKFFSGDHL